MILILVVTLENAAAGDLADSPEFAPAMAVETVKIDGFSGDFPLREIRPDFEDTAPNSHRTRTSLNGDWRFRFDPEAIGIAKEWQVDAEQERWTAVTVPTLLGLHAGSAFLGLE